MEICGEEDRFRGDKISIAPLQISKQTRNAEELDQIGHFYRRKDVVNVFSQKPSQIISHEQIFEEAKHDAEISSTLCSTDEAKIKHTHSRSNLVFISGQAGIGKSTLSKVLVKQMLDSKVPLYNAELVFFVRFRDIDYESTTNLLQFLSNSAPFVSNISDDGRNRIIHHLEANKNVFLVLDGFDEATFELKKNYSICDATSNTTAAVFIHNLLSGRILPNSKKIVTSRPRQLAHLSDKFSSYLYLNLLGLSHNSQCQICADLCGNDPDRQQRILEDINSRPDLKSLCYVPVNCIMVMMSLFSSSSARKNIDTLSAILISALQEWFLKKFEGEFQTKEISLLAYNGFLNGQLTFKEFDLKKAKINFENTTTFLTNNIKFQLLQGKAVTYFAHLIWQEFFVAVKLRLYTNSKEFSSILPNLDGDKYEVVTRFLYGLCNKHTLDELVDYVEVENLNSEVDRDECKKKLKQVVIEKLHKHHDDKNDQYLASVLPVFGWVREMGENDFTKQAAACIKDVICIRLNNKDPILPRDVPNINHILRFRETSLVVEVIWPTFYENCSQYFFNELAKTFDQNANVRVSEK